MSLNDVAGMAFRGVLSGELVDAIIMAHSASLEIPTGQLEAHHLAGGSALAVVKAAVTLQETHDRVGFPFLAAIDLGRMPVGELAVAFAAAVTRHPSLRFNDIVARFQAGEDVLGAANRGELSPPSEADGWMVRIEQGPFTRDTLRMLLRKGHIPREALIRGPGVAHWVRADSISELAN